MSELAISRGETPIRAFGAQLIDSIRRAGRLAIEPLSVLSSPNVIDSTSTASMPPDSLAGQEFHMGKGSGDQSKTVIPKDSKGKTLTPAQIAAQQVGRRSAGVPDRYFKEVGRE
jgi:hypothetical protein